MRAVLGFAFILLLSSASCVKFLQTNAFSESNCSGSDVYNAAARYDGTPYVYGGGNCNGPTNGGFDCSGLALYSICKVTGKKLVSYHQIIYLP